MNEADHYTDLVKAHSMIYDAEDRWHFYSAYIENKNPNAWFRSPHVPLKEGLLLFGWVQSWDPFFRGDLQTFLQIYEEAFSTIKSLEKQTLIGIELSDDMVNSLSNLFEAIGYCCKTDRFESTDASKILHAIIPQLFVMWDTAIRKNVLGNPDCRYGSDYASEFMPKMQEFAMQILNSYVRENGGDNINAARKISEMADGHTIAKIIDEYNFLRYTKRKSLSEIRSVPC